jgi:hypothetical protein
VHPEKCSARGQVEYHGVIVSKLGIRHQGCVWAGTVVMQSEGLDELGCLENSWSVCLTINGGSGFLAPATTSKTLPDVRLFVTMRKLFMNIIDMDQSRHPLEKIFRKLIQGFQRCRSRIRRA